MSHEFREVFRMDFISSNKEKLLPEVTTRIRVFVLLKTNAEEQIQRFLFDGTIEQHCYH